MKNKIIDLIDFEKVNVLLEGFNKSTGFVTAILDLEGNVLSKSGWRQACTDFHRIHPETAKKCLKSDTVLAANLTNEEKYHFYECLNGLVDVAVPIVIKGEHIANLFSGQFFFEKPNMQFFTRQAEKYNFDKKVYLDAINKVPVIKKEKVKTAMNFLLEMTELIVEMTVQRLEQEELNIAIQESEEKYRLLHEAAGVGIGYYTSKGKIISFNNAAAKYLNGKPEDFAGKSLFDLFPKTVAKLYMERIKKAIQSVSPQEYKDEVQLSGDTKWFKSIYTKIQDKNNKIAGIQIISTDITQEKQTEEALKLNEERFRGIYEQSPIAIEIYNKEGHLIDANQQTLNMFGVSHKKHVLKFNLWTDLNFPEEKIEQLKNGKPVFLSTFLDFEKIKKQHSFSTLKNEKIYIDIYAIPLIIEESIAGFLVQLIDVSDRKEFLKTLLDRNAYIEEILENMPIGFAVNSINDGNVKFINNKFGEIYGWPKDILTNTSIFFEKVFPNPEYRLQLQTKIMSDIESGNSERMNWKNLEITTQSGETRYVYAINIPLPEQNLMISTVQDVTKGKLAEDKINNLNTLLNQTGKMAKVGGWELDLQSSLFYFTDEIYDIYELPHGVTLNLEEGLDLYPPETQEIFKEALANSRKKNVPFDIETEITTKNGNKKWLRSQWLTEQLNGKAIRLIGTLQDITERKYAELDLVSTRNTLEEAQKIAQLGTFEYVAATQTTVWSEEEYRIYGLNPDEPSPDYEIMLRDCIHPDDADLLHTTFMKALQNFSVYELEHRIVRPDGSVRWIYDRAKPYFNKQGELVRYIGVTLDITERKKMEAEILQKNINLTSLLNISQNISLNLDLDVVLRKIIISAIKLINLDTGAIYLINDNDLYLGATIPEIPSDFPEVFRHSLLKEHPIMQEAVSSRKLVIVPDMPKRKLSPAEQKICETRKMRTLIYLPLIIEKRVLGVLILATQNKTRTFNEEEINIYRTMSGQAALAIYNSQLYNQINKLNEELENTVKERTSALTKKTHELTQSQDALLNIVEDLNDKSRLLEISTQKLKDKNKELETFTYSVSHDLKAPLRGIDGYGKLLQEIYAEKLDEEGQLFIKTIRDSTKQMHQLIEDLLTYSRLERAALKFTRVNLQKVFNNILSIFKNEIENRNILIKNNIPDIELITDQNSLTIVIQNIIENALKFTKEVKMPEININLQENNNALTVSISDNGIGFDMTFKNRIFEIFQRLNLPEQYPGTGVGLALVQKSMERMRGKVWAESELNKGSVFYLEFPKKDMP